MTRRLTVIRIDLFSVCRVRKFIRQRYTLDKREAARSRLAVGLFCCQRDRGRTCCRARVGQLCHLAEMAT